MMRSRVSAAFAAGGLPGPLDAFGTPALCHTAFYIHPGFDMRAESIQSA
jgi:hypothetical protein